MSALSTAAHNKPILVKDLLPTLLPLLYDQTVVKVCFYISGSCSPCSAIFVHKFHLLLSCKEYSCKKIVPF